MLNVAPSSIFNSVEVAVRATFSFTLGLVRVLLVRVSAPVNVAKLSSDNAVLNSEVVPDIVFEARLIVLFVKVCVSEVPTISPVTP